MKLELYNKAKSIREDIDKIESKTSSITRIKNREEDEDFMFIKSEAVDCLDALKSIFERKFEEL